MKRKQTPLARRAKLKKLRAQLHAAQKAWWNNEWEVATGRR